jgi:DNA-binding XRE family transcriptional regulator
VDETSVFNWESNRVEPAVRFIPAIIRFLGYCPYESTPPITEWLKFPRQGLGFSQERMAKTIGIDESTWRRWEAAQRQPASADKERIKVFLASFAMGDLNPAVQWVGWLGHIYFDTFLTHQILFIGKVAVVCRSVRGAESIGEDFPVWLAGRAVRFSQNLRVA